MKKIRNDYEHAMKNILRFDIEFLGGRHGKQNQI